MQSTLWPEAFEAARLNRPTANPFSEIELPNNQDHRFQKGGVDANKLLEQAVAELADTDVEVFKTVVLALTLGLRRNQIDKVEYSMFNLDQGTLSVDNSEHLHAKSERSRGVVELEPALIPIIYSWQAKATGTFVLESQVKPKPESKYQHYRAAETFARATRWAKVQGGEIQRAIAFLPEVVRQPYLRQTRHLRGITGAQACRHRGRYSAVHEPDRERAAGPGRCAA